LYEHWFLYSLFSTLYMINIWQQQLDLVRGALADSAVVTHEELLLVRDKAGMLLRQMEPPSGAVPREAAVLLLLYPHDGELWLPLTVRSSRLPSHRGEVSLPGGATDPEDTNAAATALREANEELSIDPAAVEVLGQLTSFYIPPSNFQLTPVVGFTPSVPTIQPNPDEVEHVFSVPLRKLLDKATIVTEEWTRREIVMQVPFFALEGYKVWGATALLLSELVARVRRLEIRG
jgi:8-oxo-dGTP pyrophosphatase MutT (NUDIX family)